MKRLMVLVVIAVSLTLVIAGGSAASPPTIDGVLSVGEWDGSFWFTDNSEGPGTGYNDDPIPVFTGYLYFDETNLYLAFDVEDTTPNTNRDFLYLTIDIPPAGVFNDPVDALYWGSVPANSSFFGEAYLTGGVFPSDRSQRVSTWGTDGGVVTARTITDEHRYYELEIPLAAIGASFGDTIGLKIQARGGQYTSTTDPQVVNYFPDMPAGITSVRADTRVEVEGNFCQLTLGPVVPPFTIVIDKAKIEETKGRVEVKGKLLNLDLDDVDISEDVTVTVGPLSETITMVEKGKKGEKWEYKRPKGDTDDIKHMTIDWKKGKFDIRMDKADLSGLTDPNNVTISIQIGDDVGSETILMTKKKHHWDYKDKHGPQGVEIEPFAIMDELKVVAYPNPIRDVDTATFQVMGTLATQVEEIRVQIYDLSGRLVWEDAALGSELDWHTDALSGDYLANGIYLYSVQVRIGGNWINQDIGKIAVLR